MEEAFAEGRISYEAKEAYDAVVRLQPVPLHTLKAELGITRDSKSSFDRALVELQMGLWVTISGARPKQSQDGQDYGWSSTVFTTTEAFWGPEVFDEAGTLSEKAAHEAIREQIVRLNPEARAAKMNRFIDG